MSGESILVVDDQATITRTLTAQLESLGYSVPAVAANGYDAVQLTDAHQPDLVLMDIRLGDGIDGIEAAEQIRSRHQVLPIVYVTAFGSSEVLLRALPTRPAGFINKPVLLADLEASVALALALQPTCAAPRTPPTLAMAEAVKYLPTGVAIVNSKCKLLFANRLANRLLGGPYGLLNSNGTLIGTSPATSEFLHDKIDAALASERDPTLGVTTLQAQAGVAPLELIIAPLWVADRAKPEGVIIYLFNPDYPHRNVVDILVSLYGLTFSEARVVELLTQGHQVTGLAVELGVTVSTLRTHLRNIYVKLGVHSQAALMRTVLTGPAGLVLAANSAPATHHYH